MTKEEYAKKYEVKELTLTLTASEENCNNENLNKEELKDSSIKHTNIKIIEPEKPTLNLKNTEHLSNHENVTDMILFNAKELKTKFEEFPVFSTKFLMNIPKPIKIIKISPITLIFKWISSTNLNKIFPNTKQK